MDPIEEGWRLCDYMPFLPLGPILPANAVLGIRVYDLFAVILAIVAVVRLALAVLVLDVP